MPQIELAPNQFFNRFRRQLFQGDFVIDATPLKETIGLCVGDCLLVDSQQQPEVRGVTVIHGWLHFRYPDYDEEAVEAAALDLYGGLDESQRGYLDFLTQEAK